MKKFFAMLFVTMFLLTGCGSDSKQKTENTPPPAQKTEKVAERPKTPAVTLNVNPSDFQQRFNSSAAELGFAGMFDIGEPQIQHESYGDSAKYQYNENLGMTEHIDKDSGNIEDVNILVSLGENKNLELFKSNMADAMIIYPAVIKAVSPNLTDSEIGNILVSLGLTESVGEWAKNDTSTNYNGVIYSKKIIRGTGIAFMVSAK